MWRNKMAVGKFDGRNVAPIFLPFGKCVSRENGRELSSVFDFSRGENFVAEFSIEKKKKKKKDWFVGSFVRKLES